MVDPTAPPVDPAMAAPAGPSEDDIRKYEGTLKDLDARSMKGDREKFITTYDRLKKFAYDCDYKDLYAGVKGMSGNLKDGMFQAAVNRAAEYIDIFGAHLYPQNPTTNTVPNGGVDQWTQRRFSLEAQVLEYCFHQGDMETHARRMLNEALLSGRGVVWYGYNPRKKVPQIQFDTVENFFCDADARNPEEINWISRKRRKPRFEFRQMFADETGTSTALIDIDKDLKGSGDKNDLIDYKVFYFRVGLHNFCADLNGEPTEDGKVEYDDSPKKYTYAEDKLVAIEDWDIPFFMMGSWPCRVLDFRLQPLQTWPKPPMEPGLTHLEAMNWLYTFYMNRVKNTSGKAYVRMRWKGSALGQQEVETAVNQNGNTDGAVIDLEVPASADPDVRKYLQALPLDSSMQEFDRAWSLTNKAFEDATGLNDLMRAGQDSRQIRTAADVDFKEKRSLTRVDDMRKQFERFLNDLVAEWSFMNRFLLTGEDVAAWFGPEAGQLWGRLGDANEQAQEQQQRMAQSRQVMMQAQQQAQMAMQAPIEPGMMPPAPPPMPTPEQIQDQMGPPQIIVMEQWIDEGERRIVAGSMRIVDHDAQVDGATIFFQTLAQPIMATPPGAVFVAGMVQEFLKLNKYSAEVQAMAMQYKQALTQMAMAPPPMAPPAKPTDEPSQGNAKASKGLAQ